MPDSDHHVKTAETTLRLHVLLAPAQPYTQHPTNPTMLGLTFTFIDSHFKTMSLLKQDLGV
jgi:hypothetical protein